MARPYMRAPFEIADIFIRNVTGFQDNDPRELDDSDYVYDGVKMFKRYEVTDQVSSYEGR